MKPSLNGRSVGASGTENGRCCSAALLLCWVPVVGDPLKLIAGIPRKPWSIYLVLVTIAKWDGTGIGRGGSRFLSRGVRQSHTKFLRLQLAAPLSLRAQLRTCFGLGRFIGGREGRFWTAAAPRPMIFSVVCKTATISTSFRPRAHCLSSVSCANVLNLISLLREQLQIAANASQQMRGRMCEIYVRAMGLG